MTKSKKNKFNFFLLAGIILLATSVCVYYFGLQTFKNKIRITLEKTSQFDEIKIGFNVLEIKGLRIHSKQDNWPAIKEADAIALKITPDWTTLFSSDITINALEIEEGYLSILRDQQGKIRILPTLLEKNKNSDNNKENNSLKNSEKSRRIITIKQIVLNKGKIDFFDASLKKMPIKISLNSVDILLGELKFPELTGRTQVSIKGIVEGTTTNNNGLLEIEGNIEFANSELKLVSSIQEIDFLLLQPYLTKSDNNGIKNGSLSLDLNLAITNGQLHAPGRITLEKIELSSDITSGLFAHISHDFLNRILENRNKKLTIRFVMTGDIRDPSFSFNEQISSTFSNAFIDSLGVDVESLVKEIPAIKTRDLKDIRKKIRKYR